MKVSNAPKFTLGTSSEDTFNSHGHHNIFSSLSRLSHGSILETALKEN